MHVTPTHNDTHNDTHNPTRLNFARWSNSSHSIVTQSQSVLHTCKNLVRCSAVRIVAASGAAPTDQRFTRFLGEHSEHEYVRKMVREGFLRFLQLHVCCFESYRTAPTHFIGSVAYYFKDILEDAAKEVGANLGTVIRSPIDKLVQYHIKH